MLAKILIVIVVAILLSQYNAKLAFATKAVPTLYSQPSYQSPVTATPGEPVMLPGFGFAADDIVVYQAIEDTTMELLQPNELLLERNTISSGHAEIISSLDIPYSLTVRWPEVAEKDRSYAIWVRNREGKWTNGIRVNDARPLWLSPAFSYETEEIGTLPRYLKVVGRNLQPAPDTRTRIKLINLTSQKEELVLFAENDIEPNTVIEQYVAKVALPPSMPPGKYAVSVNRDGRSWVSVDGQVFTVYPNPGPPNEFHVTSFGCRPNDGQDDTDCIRQAVKEAGATNNSYSIVVLREGIWNFNEQGETSRTVGIDLVKGVSLKGAGAARTTLLRDHSHAKKETIRSGPWFILQGNNIVQDITFKDTTIYTSARNSNAVLQLGKPWHRTFQEDSRSISNVIITNNVFNKPFRAIVDGGLPIERLFIIHNEFGAYENAILLDGFPATNSLRFHLDDSVITNNIFKPGSYMDVSMGRGTIASQIGASRRLDFSNNVADGQSVEYLYDPKKDARGWRAAFFWHLRNNHEMLLVSKNTATCTGDKTGDGESFAFDNNHNSFGFSRVQNVVSATRNTVTVPGPLQTHHEGRRLSHGFFNESWVQVADGPGIGQVRHVASYEKQEGRVKITVTPPWDVIPGMESRIAMGHEFWQLFVLDNKVDHRNAPCLKSNRRKTRDEAYGAGVIGLWAQAADTVIAGNTQWETDGITVHPFYNVPEVECADCYASSFLQHFVTVRGNKIDGEYRWASDCSWSGITVSYGASKTESAPPPTIAYGLTIAKNRVTRADGLSGGAISIAPSWWDGPKSYTTPLVRNTLIYGNMLKNMKGHVLDKSCRRGVDTRSSIMLATSTVSNTIIDSNICVNSNKPSIKNKGRDTLFIQHADIPKTCTNAILQPPSDVRIVK